ncbi:MAG: MurT ligase domain-containing protein [Clostridia bacterium]|nr:MurT ligase domain-containing protein [Clostridia bacterium]
MSFRFLFAMAAAKLSRAVIRLFGRDGSCTPGIIAIRLCPDFLRHLKMPDKVICITGTNGKTTTSNLVAGIVRDLGYTVTNNSLGSNVQGGVATALLADSTLTGKPKKQVAVLEVDERSSLLVYKYITPDFLVCNNIMRDSLKRNAHTDFIAYILGSALSEKTHVILNADDFICSSLFPKCLSRTYFGISADRPDSDRISSRDIVYCPDCGTRLHAEYVRFDHIGRIYCPGCLKKSPEPDYCVTEIDASRDVFKIRHGGEEREYKLVNSNIVNLYNFCGAVAVLTEAGFDPDKVCAAFNAQKIVKSRYDFIEAGKLSITTQLAKGQNPVACARAFSYIASLPKKNKCVLVMTDDKHDNTNNSESVCWIYDTDFSALRDDSISEIIFAGKRCRDQRLRAVIAGVDPRKIRINDDLFEGAKMIDTDKYSDIYVLHDPYILSETGMIKNYLIERGKANED